MMCLLGEGGEKEGPEKGRGKGLSLPNHVMGVKELTHTHANTHTLTLTQRNVDA